MKRDNINNEIISILENGVNKEKIKTSPFFTTRVMGKVEQLEDKKSFSISSYFLKPAFVLLILVNVVNFYFFGDKTSVKNTESSDIESVAMDYAYASNDFIFNEDLISNSEE